MTTSLKTSTHIAPDFFLKIKQNKLDNKDNERSAIIQQQNELKKVDLNLKVALDTDKTKILEKFRKNVLIPKTLDKLSKNIQSVKIKKESKISKVQDLYIINKYTAIRFKPIINYANFIFTKSNNMKINEYLIRLLQKSMKKFLLKKKKRNLITKPLNDDLSYFSKIHKIDVPTDKISVVQKNFRQRVKNQKNPKEDNTTIIENPSKEIIEIKPLIENKIFSDNFEIDRTYNEKINLRPKIYPFIVTKEYKANINDEAIKKLQQIQKSKNFKKEDKNQNQDKNQIVNENELNIIKEIKEIVETIDEKEKEKEEIGLNILKFVKKPILVKNNYFNKDVKVHIISDLPRIKKLQSKYKNGNRNNSATNVKLVENNNDIKSNFIEPIKCEYEIFNHNIFIKNEDVIKQKHLSKTLVSYEKTIIPNFFKHIIKVQRFIKEKRLNKINLSKAEQSAMVKLLEENENKIEEKKSQIKIVSNEVVNYDHSKYLKKVIMNDYYITKLIVASNTSSIKKLSKLFNNNKSKPKNLKINESFKEEKTEDNFSINAIIKNNNLHLNYGIVYDDFEIKYIEKPMQKLKSSEKIVDEIKENDIKILKKPNNSQINSVYITKSVKGKINVDIIRSIQERFKINFMNKKVFDESTITDSFSNTQNNVFFSHSTSRNVTPKMKIIKNKEKLVDSLYIEKVIKLNYSSKINKIEISLRKRLNEKPSPNVCNISNINNNFNITFNNFEIFNEATKIDNIITDFNETKEEKIDFIQNQSKLNLKKPSLSLNGDYFTKSIKGKVDDSKLVYIQNKIISKKLSKNSQPIIEVIKPEIKEANEIQEKIINESKIETTSLFEINSIPKIEVKEIKELEEPNEVSKVKDVNEEIKNIENEPENKEITINNIDRKIEIDTEKIEKLSKKARVPINGNSYYATKLLKADIKRESKLNMIVSLVKKFRKKYSTRSVSPLLKKSKNYNDSVNSIKSNNLTENILFVKKPLDYEEILKLKNNISLLFGKINNIYAKKSIEDLKEYQLNDISKCLLKNMFNKYFIGTMNYALFLSFKFIKLTKLNDVIENNDFNNKKSFFVKLKESYYSKKAYINKLKLYSKIFKIFKALNTNVHVILDHEEDK